MKKVFKYFILIIGLFISINVYAVGSCIGNKIETDTSGNGATSKRTLTLKKDGVTCDITFSIGLGAQTKKYYLKFGNKPQENAGSKINYKCNGFNVEFDNAASNGFNLGNLNCGYDEKTDMFKITGIENQGSYGTSTKCSGADYNITKDGKTCKVEITIDEYKKVTLKYGDKNNFGNAISKKNPNINEFDCIIDDTTIHITSDQTITDGNLKSCPILKSNGSTELDNSNGEHTNRDDVENFVNGKRFEASGTLEDLLNKYRELYGGNTTIKPNDITNCTNIINGKLNNYLIKIFSIMKYAGIVLCIGLTIYDFAKALLDSDKNALNKITKRALTRLVLVALLFFLPTLVNFLISIFVDNPCKINF